MVSLKNLAKKIKDYPDKVALIIGPDIIKYHDQNFFSALREKIDCNGDPLVSKVFKENELFLVEGSYRKGRLAEVYKEFLEESLELREVYNYIQHLPFKLIISMIPDPLLATYFPEAHIDHYLKPGNNYKKGISNIHTEPSDSPTIYYLLGHADYPNSLILTFDDLFTFLESNLGETKLPEYIRNKLGHAETFIFLGVKFDKWYMQLMLRIIIEKDRENKGNIVYRYASNNISKNEELLTIYQEQFGVTFMDYDSVRFLKDLQQEYNSISLTNEPLVKMNKTIFISYNHKDKEIVEKICLRLTKEGFDLIIDKEDNLVGNRIEDFILRSVNAATYTLCIISENSLLSSWVAKEAIESLKKKKGFLKPCFIDESFFDVSFVNKAAKLIDFNIEEVNKEYNFRLQEKLGIEDLNSFRARLLHLRNNIDSIVGHFRDVFSLDLTSLNFNKNLNKLVDDLKFS